MRVYPQINSAFAILVAGSAFGQPPDPALPRLHRQLDQVGIVCLSPELAKKVAAVIRPRSNDREFTLMVLRPGDKDGQTRPEYVESCGRLHGALIDELYRQSNIGGFKLVPLEDIGARFGAVPADSLDVKDAKKTAALMAKFAKRVDALVLGCVEVLPPRPGKDGRGYRVRLEVVFADGEHVPVEETTWPQPPAKIPPSPPDPNGKKFDRTDGVPREPWSKVSSKFWIDIVALDKDGAEHILEIKTDRDDAGHEILYVEVPKKLGIGTRYKIRLINGEAPPALLYKNPREEDRLYLAAVLIDGVNSIYQRRPDKTIGPVLPVPYEARKWFLANPGRQVEVRKDVAYAVPAGKDGTDHSRCEIPGFQRDGAEADQFLFGNVRESLASGLGVNAQPGYIEVHIFAQKMPGDFIPKVTTTEKGIYHLGTRAGERIPNPVQVVKAPDLYPKAVESWRILYRLEGGLPVGKDKLTPLIGQ